jgi:hypothetical protein
MFNFLRNYHVLIVYPLMAVFIVLTLIQGSFFGPSTVYDTMYIESVQPKPPIVERKGVVTVDEKGKYTRIKVDTPKGEIPRAVLALEPDTTRRQFIISDKGARWFPDLRPQKLTIRGIGESGGATVITQREPIIKFKVRPTLGVSYNSRDTYLSVGTTLLRVGPVYLGGAAALNVDGNLDFYGQTGIDIRDHLFISLGLGMNQGVSVGIKYHF